METLKILDQEYPIHPGYGTIVLLGERTGLDFEELMDKFLSNDKRGVNNFFTFLADFTICLVERGLEESGKEPVRLDKYKVIDWLADGNANVILQIFIKSAPKFDSKNLLAPEAGQP
jgi:hypothetical protein